MMAIRTERPFDISIYFSACGDFLMLLPSIILMIQMVNTVIVIIMEPKTLELMSNGMGFLLRVRWVKL